MRKWALLAIVMAWSARAELPAFYKDVDRVIWVVKDLDSTLAAWKPTGFVQVEDRGEVDDEAQYKGQAATAHYRWAMGTIGGLRVIWGQPTSGSSVFVDFAKTHGEGVAAILHRAPSAADIRAEIKRMESLGVPVVHRGNLSDDAWYVIFDTAKQGKYLIGLVYDPINSATTPKISQYAFMVRDHDTASKFWAKLGWPEMSVTHPALTEMTYMGKPAEYDAKLGWQRHGKVVYEWILPVKGPSAWHDHLENHGEGFHHLGVNVDEMDAAIAAWERAGFRNVQAGAWGEKGKKGSGRFAYLSSPASGGVDIELLWNYR